MKQLALIVLLTLAGCGDNTPAAPPPCPPPDDDDDTTTNYILVPVDTAWVNFQRRLVSKEIERIRQRSGR